MSEHVDGLDARELQLVSEAPDGRPIDTLAVTCLALLAAERLAVGDHVGVTGWLRTETVTRGGDHRQRVDVMAERLDFLGQMSPPRTAPDGRFEAANEDR